MNRRDALASLGAAVAAATMSPTTVKAIEAEPRPLCFVVETDKECHTLDPEAVQKYFDEVFGGKCPVPVIVCLPGMTVKAIGGTEIVADSKRVGACEHSTVRVRQL